jgi:hypothetical protein
MKINNITKAAKTIMSMCTDFLMGGLSEEMFVFNIKGYAKYIEEEHKKIKDKKDSG